ncbi:MAG: GTP cyclohydrolase I FolE [Anaerolineales bacterium]|jgi:GTP cyclohydrolase I|nr:GTP cyclohydrolase I FolE [Anaerolineales bacterium]
MENLNGKNNGHGIYSVNQLFELDEMEGPVRPANPQLAAAMIATPQDASDQAIESSIWELLLNLGEDPERDGLLNTPRRVRKMYRELLGGYTTDPVALINNAIFDVDYSELVLVKDIELHSLCEHHMLPFIGKAHVAYLPDSKVLGLSKIPRIVDMYSRRLQVQERLTAQIADFLEEILQPRGVAVVVEAAHMCATLRGVKKADTRMVTQTLRGEFKTNTELRRDLMQHINRPSSQELF